MPSTELAATLQSAGIEPGSEAWETCVSLEAEKQEAVQYLTGGDLYADLLAGMGSVVGAKEVKQLKKVLDHAYAIRAFNAVATVLGAKMPSTVAQMTKPAVKSDEQRWVCHCNYDNIQPMELRQCPRCNTFRIGQPTVNVGVAKLPPAAAEALGDNQSIGWVVSPKERFWVCHCHVARDRKLSGKACPICGLNERKADPLEMKPVRMTGITRESLRRIESDPYAVVFTKRSPKGDWRYIIDTGTNKPDPRLKDVIASLAAGSFTEDIERDYGLARPNIARIKFQYRRYIGELNALPEGERRFEYLQRVFGKGK